MDELTSELAQVQAELQRSREENTKAGECSSGFCPFPIALHACSGVASELRAFSDAFLVFRALNRLTVCSNQYMNVFVCMIEEALRTASTGARDSAEITRKFEARELKIKEKATAQFEALKKEHDTKMAAQETALQAQVRVSVHDYACMQRWKCLLVCVAF